MSVNNINRKKGETITNNHVYRVIVVLDDDPYWDEGVIFYPYTNRGTSSCGRKRIRNYQRRMYRTWKYNRKHQWKINRQTTE